MIRLSTLASAVLAGLMLASPLAAQEAHEATPIAKQPWTFAGPFGTYDTNQLRRGFQVFQNVCAGCHSARLLAFRNLEEEGGPEYDDGQVKALAATMQIPDAAVKGGTRPGIPADHWPNPFPNPQDAIDTFGVVPPDLSVMAKARGIEQPFPWWVFNYFTAYAEGGPDYIHALLMGYREAPPEGFQLPDGKYYNDYFPGHAISMPPPLSDGVVSYAEAGDFPQTADQYARDVSAFLMWVAEPHLVARKEAGLRVITFLILLAGLMWFVKQRLWRPVHHHNPSADEVAASGVATMTTGKGPAEPPRTGGGVH